MTLEIRHSLSNTNHADENRMQLENVTSKRYAECDQLLRHHSTQAYNYYIIISHHRKYNSTAFNPKMNHLQKNYNSVVNQENI